jgi:hypothetical protein
MKSTALSTPIGPPITSPSSPDSAAGSPRPAAGADAPDAPASAGTRPANDPAGPPRRHRRGSDEGALRVGVAALRSAASGTATPPGEPLLHGDPPITGATATALLQAELRLRGIYTALATPAAQAQHGHHQQALAQAMGELKALPRADGLDFREVVARELPGLLQKTGFDAGIYAARNGKVGGYGRYLLHSDPDPKERFCLQIFAFDPRQKTPIHNHPKECASYIAQGTLMERLYKLPEAAPASDQVVQVTKEHKNLRPQASWAGFDRTQLQVPHSLKNKSGSMAVSVHLYRDMDGVSADQQVAAADTFERFKP